MGRLKPQPFREIKRRLEALGFVEANQKGSHVKFVRRSGKVVDTAIVPRRGSALLRDVQPTSIPVPYTKRAQRLTAIIKREADGFVLYPGAHTVL